MTGIALATLVVVAAALAGVVRVFRQHRRAEFPRIVQATAGGRAFAAHLGSLSDAGTGLEAPSVHGAWRNLGSLASSR